MRLSHHHIGLTTRDVAKSTDFYLRLFGAELLPAPAAGHTLIRIAGLQIALVPWRAGDPCGHAWGDHLAFVAPVGDRAELLARLSELGCEYEHVRGRIYTRDPDGYTLEFIFE